VRRGLRRREAQARCPELVVLPADAERDARQFERVVRAVEEVAPGVEVVRAGLVALPSGGPLRYFGGVREAAERLIDQVATRAGVECQVGIADGLFAATLAAHRGVIVEPGRTEQFLGPLAVDELGREPGVDRDELIGLLHRLGLRSLGAFAALPAGDVASRFGSDAVLAHRLARGLDPRPPARRRPPVDLAVAMELDPPAVRVDEVAFAARGLAHRLHAMLAAHGLACTRLGIEAHTADGLELTRVWRCAEPLTAAATADRTRWQLDAWLAGEQARNAPGRPATGVVRVRLSGEEVVVAGTLQPGLWGDADAADERAARALVRVQAMLGPSEVGTAVLGGGRGHLERVRWVPWGDDRQVLRGGPSAEEAARPAPWPGRLPAPSPTVVPGKPPPAEVVGATGRQVLVDEGHLLTEAPVRLVVADGQPEQVWAWAGPWPIDQRWWDQDTGWRGSHLQVLVAAEGGAGEVALLLLFHDGGWSVIGRYD
jgi:protein ImuB